MMRLYPTTLFLPSPAVPYVRLSLFITTRWKLLPPRHSCDTQAHHPALFAPVPRDPSLRGVIQSTSIFAHTIPSVSLIDSSRFQIYPYAGGLCHSRIVPDCLADLPQFNLRLLLYMPPSLPRQVVSLHLSDASQDVSVFTQSVEVRHPLPALVIFYRSPGGQLMSRGCDVRFMLRPV